MKILPSCPRGLARRRTISPPGAYQTAICCGSSCSPSASSSWQLRFVNSYISESYITRINRIVVGLLLLLFLGRSDSPASQENGGVWLDVPFVKQSEDGCGSAAISMAFQYCKTMGIAVDPQPSSPWTLRRVRCPAR